PEGPTRLEDTDVIESREHVRGEAVAARRPEASDPVQVVDGEVGCGIGSDLVRFAKAEAYVTGIDLSPKSVGEMPVTLMIILNMVLILFNIIRSSSQNI
ncbi:hypothetical protein LCGC14_0505380, partial [marine sediment metagenome]